MQPLLFLKLYHNLEDMLGRGSQEQIFKQIGLSPVGQLFFVLEPHVQLRFTMLIQIGAPALFGQTLLRPESEFIFSDHIAPLGDMFEDREWCVPRDFSSLESVEPGEGAERKYREIATGFLNQLLLEFVGYRGLILKLFPNILS